MSVKWEGCLFTLLLILTGLVSALAQLSDLRRCADPQCREPISKGRTVIGYPSSDKQILSFPINAEVIVFSKEAGSRRDLWGVEIKGKRGYVPKQYVREYKIFVSKPEYEVPTEGHTKDDVTSGPDKSETDVDEKPQEVVADTETENEAHSEPEIALSAEDIEYNQLRKNALLNQNKDPHKEDVNVYSEGDMNDAIKAQNSLDDAHDQDNEELEDLEEEEEEEENEDGEDDDVNDGEYLDGEEMEILNHEQEEKAIDADNNNLENSAVVDDVVESVQGNQDMEQPISDTKQNNESEMHKTPDTETPTTTNSESPQNSNVPTNDEPSPVNYEVIDGTTLYLEDTTPLPATEEVLTPVNIMASTVTQDDYVTELQPPILSQASYEGALDQDSNIEVTSTLNLDTGNTVIMESSSESVVTESAIEPTETLPSEEVTVKAEEVDGTEKSIDPTSSWLADATASVTSWFGNNEEETDDSKADANQAEGLIPEDEDQQKLLEDQEKVEEHEQVDIDRHSDLPSSDANLDKSDSDGFGVPKEKSIIDDAETIEKDVQNEKGFFSSWFGSSEDAADETTDDLLSEDSGLTKSDEQITDDVEVDLNKVMEDSAIGSQTDSSNPVPSDTTHIPVDTTESPEVFSQPPYATADVDDAYNTPEPPIASVDPIPDTPSPLDMDENPSNPSELEEMVFVDPSASATQNDHVDVVNDEGDDDDLSTSTARPLYAVPDPSSQEHPSDNLVDDEDLSRIAGKGAVMDGSETLEGDSAADVSLSEGLMKTSHNLWLTVSRALQLPEGLAFGFEAEVAEPQVSNGMLIFLLIVAGTVVSIYFVHLIMVKISREAPLLEALNRIDREQRVKADENTSLHTELLKAKADLENVSTRVTTSCGDVDEISSQLEMVKNEYAGEKSQLEERVVQLEHELEEATNNGIEMHKMLSEMLSAQKEASAFQASVDHLQSMLDGQREKVETLTSDLALKNRLNEELHVELKTSMERASKLDYQVEQLTHSLEELTGIKGEEIRKLQQEAAVVEELKQANLSLSEQAGEYDSKVLSLTDELEEIRDTVNQLRESVETKESELQVAKECLKQLRLTSSDENVAPDEEKLSALFDVIRVKAELEKVNKDRLTLVEQLQDSETAQKNLEDVMESIKSEVSELRTHHDVAIREKQEAMSKLEVLTKYFEEKEAQLTKELESQEGLRVNAEGSAASIASKIQNYELERVSYKTQVESLRKELEEQESSYKTQIASHEQRAHENWLQARAAERKHEEQRQENSQLRSRLTIIQKEKEDTLHSQVNIIKPTPKRVDANGTMSSPRPMVDGVEGDHSGPSSLHRDLDSPPIPPPHGMPPMLPMMFPPGGPPLPPGVPPPHGLPPGVHPPPGLPQGLPPHPFLPGEPPFMGHLPPLPGDRRLPPAGGMSSPPFRRSGSPTYDHRNDRYSPISDRSHMSDRRYSPPPLRRRPLSPDMHRNRSPDRRSDRTRSPDRRSDRMRRSPDHRNERRSPDRRSDRRSPDRHYNRSPDGYSRHRTSPRNYYDEDFNNEDSRLRSHHMKGKKTSTPLAPNDR